MPAVKKRSKKTLGFSKAQVEAAAAHREKSTSSTPALVLNAFCPDEVRVGKLPLQPCTGAVIMQLQKIGSSLLKTEKSEEFNVEDIFAALFVMSQPIAHVRALTAIAEIDPLTGKIFRPRFDDAVFELAATIDAALLPQIGEILNAHLVAAFGTAVPHGQKVSRDPNSPFPTAPANSPGTAGS